MPTYLPWTNSLFDGSEYAKKKKMEEGLIMRYEFHPKLKLLLQKHSSETVHMTYINHKWSMPKTTVKPPYYKKPIYELHYPKV